MRMYFIKPGGSVLRNPDDFRKITEYVKSKESRELVILPSAMYEVSSELEKIFVKRNRKGYVSKGLKRLENMYIKTLEALPTEYSKPGEKEIKREMGNLERDIRTGARDAAEGSGEGHTGIILHYFMKAAGLNTSNIIGPEAGFILDEHGRIDLKRSVKPLSNTIRSILSSGNIPILGTYIGESIEGGYKRSPRNYNDTYATAGAAVMKIMGVDDVIVEIIKNVPGVYHVEEKYGNYGLLNNLSHNETGKLGKSGSPVLYPNANTIARKYGLTVVIKDVESPGTIISNVSQTTPENPVASIVTSIDPVITVLDEAMDTGEESIGYLRDAIDYEAENAIPIGVGAFDTGEISYTIPIGNTRGMEKSRNTEILKKHPRSLKKHLASRERQPEHIYLDEEMSVITVIGDAMKNRPGMLAYISGIVGDAGVSIRAAVQTLEKYTAPSITFVVDKEDLDTSVRALCSELFRE